MSDSGVPPHEMFGLFDTVLDPDTAERLLAGRLLLDDAPPDAHAVTQVINRLSVAPTAAELEHETAAVSAIAETGRTRDATFSPGGRFRATMATSTAGSG